MPRATTRVRQSTATPGCGISAETDIPTTEYFDVHVSGSLPATCEVKDVPAGKYAICQGRSSESSMVLPR